MTGEIECRQGSVPSEHDHRPTAIGVDRPSRSGLDSPRRAAEIRRHAEELGYRLLYTVRPPHDHGDPIGYALGIARGIRAEALFAYDLDTVDHQPGRVTAVCALETVNPAQSWDAACPSAADPGQRPPDVYLSIDVANRVVQQHLSCRTSECLRKAAALNSLIPLTPDS
ncbi:hypothetical protein [Nocardia terpenica]|uniref:Uncharacterized protein n=1 Tax=Nocardia terpenica TaxID=455432 RepID=A0A6G9ZDB2_9NOCA|nr:hypothetical protein [Nocardia terpenica]QIS23605.1 hypothetical protein F6W96_40405 [Nocardia terpenica]